MKKILVIVLAVMICVAVVACGPAKNQTNLNAVASDVGAVASDAGAALSGGAASAAANIGEGVQQGANAVASAVTGQ
ncbi:MAG TPA: hypothetical protein DEB31_05000 [Clostridiales bacterium]|nr:hypothetical protein [Clostridiales bacterium]